MQHTARLAIPRLPAPRRGRIAICSYSTRRPRRVEPRAQDLSARFQQLERTLRTKETLEDQLADTHHVRSSANLAPSSQDIQPRRLVKPSRMFHGLIIPDKPSEPEADECCMSGCAVCVYDLYDESLQSYKESLAAVRASLAKMDIPEADWPADIRAESASTPSTPREKSVALSAFEEMERQLLEKRTQQANIAASREEKLRDPNQSERERTLARQIALERVKQMREKKARVTLKDVYEALRWITFSNR
ncbi:unnamed protein product [Peniophora sp. CBMAI 1063]|nr:unnamed protein product [Peniophora sp. CBMAI 1063]